MADYASDLTPSQRVSLAKDLILQAPPGEVNDVVNDVRMILDDEPSFQSAVGPALAQHNHEQFIIVDFPGSSHKTIIAEAALLRASDPPRYYEPRSNQSFSFDHSTLTASSPEPVSLPESTISFISSFNQPLNHYISNHFSLGAGCIFPSFLPSSTSSNDGTITPGTSDEPLRLRGGASNVEDKPSLEHEHAEPATEAALVGTADEVVQVASQVEKSLSVRDGDEGEEERAQAAERVDEEEMEGEQEGIEQPIGGGGEVREEVEQPVEVTMEQLEEIQQTGEPVEEVIQHSHSHPDEAQREGETTEPEAPPAPAVEVTMEQLEEIQQTGEPVEEVFAHSAPPHQVEEEEEEKKEEDLSFPTQVVGPVEPQASSEEAAAPLLKAPEMMEREIVPEPEPVVEEGPKELRVDENKYTLVISGHRYSTSNFWTGRWRSSYAIDLSKDTVEGEIQVVVHYFEQGNVQLHTLSRPSFALPSSSLSSPPSPSSILKQIALLESSAQEAINAQLEELSGGAFKSLRRALPVTRQKMDWDKVSGYRLGKGIGGGGPAAGGERREVEAGI